MHHSKRTAMARKKISGPAQYLVDTGRLKGRVLDYGSGRGFDAQSLKLRSYDPHWGPSMPDGEFDTVMCNYVLNVLPEKGERDKVIAGIKQKLKVRGVAYIAVRNDRENLNGYTKIGTWQGLIKLDLPVVATNSNYKIYKLEKTEEKR